MFQLITGRDVITILDRKPEEQKTSAEGFITPPKRRTRFFKKQ